MRRNTNQLIDLVRHLDNRGIRHIFLDEVHKYPNWAQNLKNIYDMYPRVNIVYTGSSVLGIDNSVVDLSRRQRLYTLRCMSFREYLDYEGIARIAPASLEQVVDEHIALAMRITSEIDILAHFAKYLQVGAYPYYKTSGPDFHVHLRETARLVIDSDIPAVEPCEYQTLGKIKRLLMIMARQIPFVPNIKNLSDQISTTRNIALKMLYLLDKANLLRLLTEMMKTYKNLVKPEKVLFDNTNLMYAFCKSPDVGTLRETFFANQIECAGEVTSPAKGDFLVEGKWLFEVGGPTKTFAQIKDIPGSYLAIDDTPVGRGDRIPLWLFGMMY